MDNIKETATHLYDLGINVFTISRNINDFNYLENNTMKSPGHEWISLINNRQSKQEFDSYDWEETSAFGCVLGYNSLMAIDIDGVYDDEIINKILNTIDLPLDYEWVINTGSRSGYHIIVRCQNPHLEKNHVNYKKEILSAQYASNYTFGDVPTNAYSTLNGANKIEFIWQGNLILPPSLHKSGQKYQFRSRVPSSIPKSVEFTTLKSIKDLFCGDVAKSSNFAEGSGYNDIQGISTVACYEAYEDSLPYNFVPKYLEKGFLFYIKPFKVYGTTVVLNQICWFIIDKNYNVIKRKSYNYYTNQNPNVKFNALKRDIANTIVDDKRYVFHELLFDLCHTSEIYCLEKYQIDTLKNEIVKAGLYLDAFLKYHEVGTDPVSGSNITLKNYGNSNFDLKELKEIIYLKKLTEQFISDYTFKSNLDKRGYSYQTISKLSTNIGNGTFITSNQFVSALFGILKILLEKNS